MRGIKIETDPKFGTLSEGKFPIAARNFGTVITIPNFPPTISTERRTLRFVGLPVDDITSFPLIFSWVNINTGALTSTVPNLIFGLPPAQFATDGIQIDNTPGDQHFIIEKRGIYSISISGKVSSTAGGFGVFDADFGFSRTPPGGIVAAPPGDGLASGTLLAPIIPTNVAGTAIVQVLEDLTRVDVWVKGSDAGVTGPKTLDIEQNLIIGITKVGEIPQN
jgi:hypothetical protein